MINRHICDAVAHACRPMCKSFGKLLPIHYSGQGTVMCVPSWGDTGTHTHITFRCYISNLRIYVGIILYPFRARAHTVWPMCFHKFSEYPRQMLPTEWLIPIFNRWILDAAMIITSCIVLSFSMSSEQHVYSCRDCNLRRIYALTKQGGMDSLMVIIRNAKYKMTHARHTKHSLSLNVYHFFFCFRADLSPSPSPP